MTDNTQAAMLLVARNMLTNPYPVAGTHQGTRETLSSLIIRRDAGVGDIFLRPGDVRA